jgi:ParB-like chromosome segregation protein Spo0J
MTYFINTIEEFKNIRKNLQPVYISSKKHGRIQVPVTNTLLVARELVIANQYNPNFVSPDKMELLQQSILDNGFCYPVVTIWDDDIEKFIIIDGFHRNTMGDEDWLDLDYIPLLVLSHDIAKRMAATIQFNKARGVHQVDLDAEVIRALIDQGLSEEDISVRLGIDLETIFRYKQLTGIAELFKNTDYSMSWEMVETEEERRA